VEESTYLLCTFNESDISGDVTKIAGYGGEDGKGGFAIYELRQRPGKQWNAAFGAFTIRVPRGLADWERIGMLGATSLEDQM